MYGLESAHAGHTLLLVDGRIRDHGDEQGEQDDVPAVVVCISLCDPLHYIHSPRASPGCTKDS